MMMKTCICIAGMPASGKTTAALRLSEKLGIAMLSKDEIKEKLFDRIGFQSRQEKVQLGLAAMEILYYAAERCLAAGESVILENNFEDLSRPGLQALQERTGCRMITILFDGETRAVYQARSIAEPAPRPCRERPVSGSRSSGRSKDAEL